tara:strand:- start:486 stop:1049 length:564 start_codon:yes stop_codon:yes gene_type:complete
MALEDMPRPKIVNNSPKAGRFDYGGDGMDFEDFKPIPPTGDKTKSSPSTNRLQSNFSSKSHRSNPKGQSSSNWRSNFNDTYCCTAAHKYHNLSITKVNELREWHKNNPKMFQDGYDVWGKIMADNIVSKYKFGGKLTEKFYEWVLKDNKSLTGLLSILIIVPMSYFIGFFIKAFSIKNTRISIRRIR